MTESKSNGNRKTTEQEKDVKSPVLWPFDNLGIDNISTFYNKKSAFHVIWIYIQ